MRSVNAHWNLWMNRRVKPGSACVKEWDPGDEGLDRGIPPGYQPLEH